MKNKIKNKVFITDLKQAGFNSQKELANDLGVSEDTISRWMRKPSKIFIEWLKLRAINISLDKIKSIRDAI